MEIEGKRVLIEVKSFPLARQDVFAIESKYRPIDFDELIIVAPSFVSAPKNTRAVLNDFEPDLTPLKEAYVVDDLKLPARLVQELETGDHHFRFLLAKRAKGETSRFRNQVDKRIKCYSDLLREIKREGSEHLPVRVFWSVSRWAYPKELFFASYSNHLLRRGLVFDIDGKTLHNDASPCRIDPGNKVCLSCLAAAKVGTVELLKVLAREGISDIQVVFSGRQGFHVYVFDGNLSSMDIQRLVNSAIAANIPVDLNVAFGRKSVVTMPGSIHGLSMLRAIPVSREAILHIEDLVLPNKVRVTS